MHKQGGFADTTYQNIHEKVFELSMALTGKA